jgi:hypothetical protein
MKHVVSVWTVALVALLAGSAWAQQITLDPTLQGRAQGDAVGQGVPHQQQAEAGNVGFNAQRDFMFKNFIVFDLSSHLVDVEQADQVQLTTRYQWGGQDSESGWKYICLGAFDDADLNNRTVLNWGEQDGNRFVRMGAEVGVGDPSQGAESFGEDGLLSLDVTEAAQRSGLSAERPYLWFRVEGADPNEGASWGGLSPEPGNTRLTLDMFDSDGE